MMALRRDAGSNFHVVFSGDRFAGIVEETRVAFHVVQAHASSKAPQIYEQ
jgi:hypothetical protein